MFLKGFCERNKYFYIGMTLQISDNDRQWEGYFNNVKFLFVKLLKRVENLFLINTSFYILSVQLYLSKERTSLFRDTQCVDRGQTISEIESDLLKD